MYSGVSRSGEWCDGQRVRWLSDNINPSNPSPIGNDEIGEANNSDRSNENGNRGNNKDESDIIENDESDIGNDVYLKLNLIGRVVEEMEEEVGSMDKLTIEVSTMDESENEDLKASTQKSREL